MKREPMRPVDTMFGARVPKPAVSPRDGQASARGRHEEKITLYLSTAELTELDRLRLELRGTGLRVDRGLMIRTALAAAFADPAEWTRRMEEA